MSFEDFLSAVSVDEFDERPVDLETFLYSEDFLNFPKLSDIQLKCVEAMTQIYRYETLVNLWGQEEADRLQKTNKQEILLYLGKGSGKDALTAVAFARIAYLLLCLKDPAKYYGKPPGDAIAMLNVAINAQQAKNVFFAYLKQRIKNCPWFEGRYDQTADSITFDKNVRAYSGHSEREAWEGYNFIIVTLDEIAGFATESEATSDGLARAKTADAIYDMYKASVISRFPDEGKIVLLSFSRYKGDFISKRYDKVVGEKQTVRKTHTFKVHEDLPDGTPDNEFTIEWDEDHIVSYAVPNVYALRRPTWYVNPTKTIDNYKTYFMENMVDGLTRFACMPSEAIDAFFKNHAAIERSFPSDLRGPFDDDWSWRNDFRPDKNRNYYIHVDLAYKHDRAAVAMASVDEWVRVNYSNDVGHRAPAVRIDAVRYWTPKPNENVNLDDIKDFILDLKRAGFPIKLVTFDQWGSVGYRQQLQRDFRINTDRLAVGKPEYEDFSLALHEKRIRGYNLPLLVEELKGLQIIKGNKVDHPRKGSKDVSDAVVGAVFNVIESERSDEGQEVEVFIGAPSVDEPDEWLPPPVEQHGPMPADLRDFLDRMQVL